MTNNSTKVAICLWFDSEAEAAAHLYTSLIPNSEITHIMRPHPDGPAVMVTFTLGGVPFQALNGGPQFPQTEAASIVVSTKDQAETDYLWDALTANGGSESQCAWLKDRFGVSWQIVPEALPRLISSSDHEASQRAMQAMLTMRKIDIAALESAYRGE